MYLGETIVDIQETEFKDYTQSDWVMYFIERYGQFDGSHHKQWVLDQAVRLLKGNNVIIKKATWSDGQWEWRIKLAEPTEEYNQWVIDMKNGEDGEDTYDYDYGIAP